MLRPALGSPRPQELFQSEPIGLGAWWRILLVAIVASAVVAVDKARLRSRTL